MYRVISRQLGTGGGGKKDKFKDGGTGNLCKNTSFLTTLVFFTPPPFPTALASLSLSLLKAVIHKQCNISSQLLLISMWDILLLDEKNPDSASTLS